MAKAKKSNTKKKSCEFKKRTGFSAEKPRDLNPFEVHVNRQKFQVLGRKLKNDRGLPGVSRAKALNKRKATLLQEYRVHNKVNEFVDKRIGENTKGMTREDKVIARFTAERNRSRKKTKFNLADDEVLTHRGQSLNEVEKFDDPRSDSEDEDEKTSGKLQADFVGDAHFGGFLSRKEDTERSKESRQNLIQELIAESKKRKAEKQRENEKTAEMTDKLDSEWKDLQSVIYNSKTKKQKNDPEEEEKPKPKLDDYDKAVRQLVYESRGVPSDRLKSEEEIATIERERLEKLEAERLARMQGRYDGLKPVPKHRSADDLDDGFSLDVEEDDQTLCYNSEGQVIGGEYREEAEESEEEGDDDAKPENSDEEESGEEEEEEDDDDDEEESEGEDDRDSLSDLRLQVSDEEDAQEVEDVKAVVVKEKQVKITTPEAPDFKKLKEMMEQARKELPYTFTVPETYVDFMELFEEKSLAQQSVILERIIKCNHPSLGADNTAKLGALYAFLLQWLNDNTIEPTGDQFVSNACEDLFNTLIPHIFEIVQLSGAGNARRCTVAVLSEKYEEWKKKGAKKIPPLDTIVFFQLVLHIFPVSDFRHPVTSPAVVFMAEILNKSTVRSTRDICNGLFICELLQQYATLSHRFLPEAFRFLTDIICAFSQNESNSRLSDNLVPSELRCDRILSAAIRILHITAEQSRDSVPCLPVMIKEAVAACEDIPSSVLKKMDKAALTSLEGLKNILLNHRSLERMMREKKRPKPLKQYEPRVEAVIYDGKRRVQMSEKKKERVKLMHKVKKEMKGAVREIRRDRDFLAKVQLKETKKSDSERRAKVKNILGTLATQAGEINKLDRSKKNKKK